MKEEKRKFLHEKKKKKLSRCIITLTTIAFYNL